MNIRDVIPCVFLLTLPAATTYATLSPTDSSAGTHGSLLVRSDVDSAIVLLDGRLIGRTPALIDAIPPGHHTVKVIHPDITNWLAGVSEDTITISPGEHRVCLVPLRRSLLFSTVPAGARVFIHDSLAGTTPLLLTPPRNAGEQVLSVMKEGYEPATTSPWDSPRGYATLPLIPLNEARNEAATSLSRSNTGRLFAIGSAMTVTGIVTAFLKIKADNRQDLYLQTGDPGLLAERNRLDRGAAATLILTQIGFGFFLYELLSE